MHSMCFICILCILYAKIDMKSDYLKRPCDSPLYFTFIPLMYFVKTLLCSSAWKNSTLQPQQSLKHQYMPVCEFLAEWLYISCGWDTYILGNIKMLIINKFLKRTRCFEWQRGKRVSETWDNYSAYVRLVFSISTAYLGVMQIVFVHKLTYLYDII